MNVATPSALARHNGMPAPDQENLRFANSKRPKGTTLGEWIEMRITCGAARPYDWKALGWQAEVDPVYRRAPTRYIGISQGVMRMPRHIPCLETP
ncbi:hypothetical protein D3C86_2044580 [compost metagenome]